MQTGQNYQNHVHQPRGWQITWAASAIAMGLQLWLAVGQPSQQSIALALLAFVVIAGLTLTRTFALRLQNRIIRLEMQLRLARLGREKNLASVSMRQLVALRFASDAELPALLDRAAAENLTPDQIKRAVTDWQGDYLRT